MSSSASGRAPNFSISRATGRAPAFSAAARRTNSSRAESSSAIVKFFDSACFRNSPNVSSTMRFSTARRSRLRTIRRKTPKTHFRIVSLPGEVTHNANTLNAIQRASCHGLEVGFVRCGLLPSIHVRFTDHGNGIAELSDGFPCLDVPALLADGTWFPRIAARGLWSAARDHHPPVAVTHDRQPSLDASLAPSNHCRSHWNMRDN